MLKNITLSAEDRLIKKAREKAAASQTTLNALFRKWLENLTGQSRSPDKYRDLMKSLSYAKAGQSFSREQMNER